MAKQKILIVEDAPDIAGLLQVFFSSQGYEALVAGRGAQAVELSRREIPDLILLDIMLPDMNGFTVCQELRRNRRTREIPIIFLTARGEKEDIIQGLQLGADDYIVKPFDLQVLEARVSNRLQRANLLSSKDPTTGLPGSRAIEEELKRILNRHDWALAYIGLEHFEPFSQAYGFVAGDNALRFVARLLVEVVDELGGPDDFVGHGIGSDFVLTTTPERVRPICERLMRDFDERIGTLYDYRDRKQGFLLLRDPAGQEVRVPLMYLAIGVVDGTRRRFSDIRELSEAAARVRQQARLEEGAGSRVALGEDVARSGRRNG
ncbi:MAG: response regulator [Chloroflexia bacterium]